MTPRQSRDLFLLAQLRAHPGCANVVACMKDDRAGWLGPDEYGDKLGTARERRDSYDLAIELLNGGT